MVTFTSYNTVCHNSRNNTRQTSIAMLKTLKIQMIVCFKYKNRNSGLSPFTFEPLIQDVAEYSQEHRTILYSDVLQAEKHYCIDFE